MAEGKIGFHSYKTGERLVDPVGIEPISDIRDVRFARENTMGKFQGSLRASQEIKAVIATL